MTRAADYAWLLASTIFAIGVIGLWYLAAELRLVSPVFLPSPARAWNATMQGFANGSLSSATLLTIERMFYGWVLSSVLGVVVGVAIGSSQLARTYLGPTLEFLRPLPASALAPVSIAFFGLTNVSVLLLIASGAIWPVLLATVHGFTAINPRLIEVSRVLKLSRAETIWKIALPNAVPDILAAMRLTLTVSLILAIVGEMLTGQKGIGFQLLLAARSFDAPNLYAGVILLGIIGFVSNFVLNAMEGWFLRWRPSR